ncbi:hypothetical protein MQX03_00145 [Chryseobacterium aahli]|uniref:hypothetical protein n=1 Tax=Chryseobacterium aahli TaxID=1278643 RepID=UPI001F604C84|nr:hypothetical protein [Chryseobacterium aahli]MCI3935592.1 hypothetical protein [Chryseobacterium aahli]
MKAKILLLIIFSGLILCCRSKTKIATTYKENIQETKKVKVDSLNLQSLQSTQSTSADVLLKEEKNEASGEILITGKSDPSNPFVFHNVIGSDTLQSISIIGNAEYSINNHYAKTDNKKAEVIKEIFTNSFQDLTQIAVAKETIKEVDSVVSEETKKIKVNGFELAVWICITVLGITLILIFFTHKYFKR